VPVPGHAEERAEVHQLQRPRVRPRSPRPLGPPPRGRFGTLNARDRSNRRETRLTPPRPSPPARRSPGTSSASFGRSSTRTRASWARTRERRSRRPRRIGGSSTARWRCTACSAPRRGASSTRRRPANRTRRRARGEAERPGEAEGPRRKRRHPSGNSNTPASFAAPLSRLPRVRPSLASPPPRARSAALPISSVTLTAPPPRPTSASRRSW
jgi:hypothetical protein